MTSSPETTPTTEVDVQAGAGISADTTGSHKVRRVLQRVVLPADRDLDVLPLYVDTQKAVLTPSEDDDEQQQQRDTVVLSTGPSVQRPEDVLDRHRLRVPAGQRVSFGTYFNAFPASYWRMYTALTQIVLDITVSGAATVIVYRSTADGRSQRVGSAGVEDEPSGAFSFALPLKPFGDGGWYWFDVVAGQDEAVLEHAAWLADVSADQATPGTATVGITTFNRAESCVELLGQFDDPEILSLLDEVLVMDQGTELVTEVEDFGRVERALDGRLRVIRQANIGGSGGFARAQFEAVRADKSKYVLLLDDDIVAEPESILRAVTFADLARTPTIVGGHMFSLYSRARLHSFGEVVNRWRFWWGAARRVRTEHDFASQNLRSTRWLHRRIDVDYNGWWMCLIPTQVLHDVGLGLPLFIKWDDAEFGLRAGEAGYPTVSLPGVAVWHVPWTDKNDALDWQAYFHQRNRTIAALLHSPYSRGGRLVRESFNHQVKHLLAMQYSTAELRLVALEDILAGPQHLHDDILGKLAQVRQVRGDFPDAKASPDPGAFPKVKRAKPPRRGKEPTSPRGQLGQLKTATLGAVRQLLPVRELARSHPEARLAALDARWWMLAQFDSAVVSSTDGTSASWYHRDPERFASLLRRSVLVHERMYREWPALASAYRSALPELTSPQRWERTFDAARPST